LPFVNALTTTNAASSNVEKFRMCMMMTELK
jgi:hypothetical protein